MIKKDEEDIEDRLWTDQLLWELQALHMEIKQNEKTEALQYRTPMKPYWNIVHYPNRTSMGIVQCPMCKRRLRINKITKKGDAYCPNCGQAIDWEPEESRLQSDTILTEEVRDASDK
jgi:predicted RNA-binding Zn-ribbon protein involved in translation (DUF1610 family)